MPPPEKPSQDEVKINGGKTDIDEPHSPPTAPQGSSPDKNSPPVAPTSTWPNLRDEEAEKEESSSDGGRRTEKDLTPLVSGRKRTRDSLEHEEDDKSSVTVRQEADSTVNFEPLSFDLPPPPSQGVDESPSKRSRECEMVGLSDGGRRGGEVGGEDVAMEEGGEEEGGGRRKSALSSSTDQESGEVATCETSSKVGEEGGGGKEGGGEVFIQKDNMQEEGIKEDATTAMCTQGIFPLCI